MSTTSISNRTDWARFAAIVENPGSTDTSTNYRTQAAALAVFNQPKPDCVTTEEFEALKARVQTNLNTTKEALIDEFLKTMEDLGVRGLNREEIKEGKLELGRMLQALDNVQKEQALKAVAKLEFLTGLDLYENKISAIPPEIGLLARLEWLDLYGNEISVIPTSIGQLSQLQRLSLHNNQIREIPPEIGLLARLEWLDLSNNQISAIPNWIGQLARLQGLNLFNNRISAIPTSIGQLSQLQGLHLHNNQIREIPTSIGQLSQLQRLSLSHNKISAIPNWIGQLARLQGLNLFNNRISAIPTSIGQLSQLQWLQLDNNPTLRELPMSLGTIPGITTLDTSGTDIPDSIRNAILAACQRLRGNRTSMSLPQKLELWARFASLSDADRQALTTLSLTEPEIISVNEWLTRLERSRDFSYAQAPLAQKTCEMLLGLQKTEWKEPFFIQVNANLECCQDRGSMAFNEIYTAWVLHSLPTDTPLQERLDLLIGVAKTLALRKELAKLIGNEAESVEIYLYYEIQMKERLKLVTAIEKMQHSRIGKRDHINEDALANAVEAHYLNELIEIPAFQTLIEKDPDYQRLFNENKTHLSTAMDELEAHKEEMSSDAYNAESNHLKDAYNQLRLTVAKAWLSQKLEHSA